MELIRLIRRLFSGREGEPPPVAVFQREVQIPLSDSAEELDTSDHDEDAAFSEPYERKKNQKSESVNDGKEILDGDLWGTTFAIEYLCSKNNLSLRRVSMRHLILRPEKSLCLSAHCFERNKLRHFRVDRIQSIIDDDGQVYDPIVFFRDELQCQIDDYMERATPPNSVPRAKSKSKTERVTTPVPSELVSNAEKPGVIQRRACRDGLRLLVGIARSDADYCEEELEAILSYVEDEAVRAGIETSDTDRTALRGYLRRQRPDKGVLRRCIDSLSESSVATQKRFLIAAEQVVLADGKVHDAERDVIRNIAVSLKEVGVSTQIR